MAGVAAVIVAAGRGSRAGGDLPKQFRPIGGEPMIRQSLVHVRGTSEGRLRAAGHSAATMWRSSNPPAAGLDRSAAGLRRRHAARLPCAPGWRRSQPRKPDIVLIHDAARPFATPALVTRAIAAAEKSGAAIPALPVTDTVKTVDADGHVHRDARPQRLAPGADAARLRLPRSARGASPRRRARPRGLHRRRRARRMGRPEGQRVCRRARQHQDHRRERFRARRSGAVCRARRRAHRHRHRRARLWARAIMSRSAASGSRTTAR